MHNGIRPLSVNALKAMVKMFSKTCSQKVIQAEDPNNTTLRKWKKCKDDCRQNTVWCFLHFQCWWGSLESESDVMQNLTIKIINFYTLIIRISFAITKVNRGFTTQNIVWPYFYKNITAKELITCYFTGEYYSHMLNNFCQQRQSMEKIIFAHGGAASSAALQQLLRHKFITERVIRFCFPNGWMPPLVVLPM